MYRHPSFDCTVWSRAATFLSSEGKHSSKLDVLRSGSFLWSHFQSSKESLCSWDQSVRALQRSHLRFDRHRELRISRWRLRYTRSKSASLHADLCATESESTCRRWCETSWFHQHLSHFRRILWVQDSSHHWTSHLIPNGTWRSWRMASSLLSEYRTIEAHYFRSRWSDSWFTTTMRQQALHTSSSCRRKWWFWCIVSAYLCSLSLLSCMWQFLASQATCWLAASSYSCLASSSRFLVRLKWQMLCHYGCTPPFCTYVEWFWGPTPYQHVWIDSWALS